MSKWMTADMPDLSERVAVVTGASAGLGLETARALAAHGATVVLACRDTTKGEAAARTLTGTKARVVELDLASLTSVREAAEIIGSTCPSLDLLVNNAGVMQVPFQRTEDGFELTFGINHLGHFALTGLLLPQLLRTSGSRVVTVTSNAHRRGDLDLDPAGEYEPGAAYDRSKLANLLFAYELHRRLQASGSSTASLAAHPGNARTALWATSSRLERVLIGSYLRPVNFWLAQSAQRGALPQLRAATDSSAKSGECYGPDGWFQYAGSPVRVRTSPDSYDRDAASRLWRLSEQLTEVRYSFAGAR
ncbi:SDR family NAD(P)-dependent oxidoreductase [Kribbella jejuensis]|uniref:NAD(P)-dependent dehydrogenase (Short-subunit alcohol dehydrogenase family) n=1 Tax=Kribbella jejuensis TaxID=236068 RepID=A0A542DSU8_9ACTN|nr:oxidoreductase [Kribbella jejuensis]TQJ06181.1 NAD(P)-dependent dehydrogenase (short-subunit alcohol dehydrogenase family) [Kribbella jejuensis]